MRRMMAVLLAAQFGMLSAHAWDTPTHRLLTYLALKGLSQDAPAWLRDDSAQHRIAYEASEADRWKGTSMPPLNHENKPDHYLDIELLDQFGLTLETLPPLRYEYLRALAIAKHVHPEKVDAYDAAADPQRYKEWPGYLPFAITGHYAKLRSSLNTALVLEAINDPQRSHQLEVARANVLYHMGMLSHFVGDAAQPLHTTKHHNGWVGDNPNGYTTSNRFHSYIDGGLAKTHKLTVANVLPHVKFDRKVNPQNPWNDTLAYLRETFELVEPLYVLERDGKLPEQPGRDFAVERIGAGASMLAALYNAAIEDAAPTHEDMESFKKYDSFNPAELTAATAAAGAGGTP